jgi:hypothetical protein
MVIFLFSSIGLTTTLHAAARWWKVWWRKPTVVCRMWCQCYPEVAVLELFRSSWARICPNCWLQNFNCFHLYFLLCKWYPWCWFEIFLSPFICGFALPVSCWLELVLYVVFFPFYLGSIRLWQTDSMSVLIQSTTARLNTGFPHQQNNNGTCYYRGWESHRPPPPWGP